MELSFDSKSFNYLKCIFHEFLCQEETAEVIVPDSFPDIDEIVDYDAQILIRGKEFKNGSVQISGGIRGDIIYIPEDRSTARTLELYIPFSLKAEDPSFTENSQLICDARIRSVDGRMLNSRKAMLRVNVGCMLMSYENEQDQLFTCNQTPDFIQLKTASYPIRVPMETSEKSFIISDRFALPLADSELNQIFKFHCDLTVTEKKLIANKAVFKGNAVCSVMYVGSDGTLNKALCKIPFSQYCEFAKDYEYEKIDLYPVLTGYDLKHLTENGDQWIDASLNILMQCMVTGEQRLDVVEDAYSVHGVLEPQWHSYPLQGWLDKQESIQAMNLHLPGQVREVVDLRFYIDQPILSDKEDAKAIIIPVNCRVLGYDANRNICSLSGREEVHYELALEENSKCYIQSARASDPYSVVQSDGVCIRGDIELIIVSYAGSEMRTICGGKISDNGETEAQIPSVVLRKAVAGTSLWEIGKANRAKPDSIRAANQLDFDYLDHDQLLLIPIG